MRRRRKEERSEGDGFVGGRVEEGGEEEGRGFGMGYVAVMEGELSEVGEGDDGVGGRLGGRDVEVEEVDC